MKEGIFPDDVRKSVVVGVLSLGAFLTLSGPSIAGEPASEPAAVVKDAAPAFAKDIAPIFQAKCEACHRKDSIAPMSLVSYQETRPWAKAIKERVLLRQMPPWHIDKTVGIQSFQNDRSLTDEQIDAIVRWVDAGAPLGDAKDMPPPKQWMDGDGWQLSKQFGPPDLIIKSDPYTMPAHGQDMWLKPLTEIPLAEPRWVRAAEIRPSTPAGRRITHHVLAQLLQDESEAQSNRPIGAPPPPPGGAGLLMEWAVGKNYDVHRANTGKLLLPGSKIRWEFHIHAVGEPISDHVELAVYLYPKAETPKYRTRLTLFWASPSFGANIDIPPNSTAQTTYYTVLKAPGRLENFQPHMHLRGKAMAMEAILPDGATEMLSYADHFNFNWMTNYIYTDDAAPVLPKGTVIKVTAWYDNTTANPNNPDPNQWVGFGDRTVDEMGHAWVNVTYISEEDYKEWAAAHKGNAGLTAQKQ